jgi:hypothetical protein
MTQPKIDPARFSHDWVWAERFAEMWRREDIPPRANLTTRRQWKWRELKLKAKWDGTWKREIPGTWKQGI